MTIATDLGFKIGELYRVVDSAGNANIEDGMIVKFISDDGSSLPLFRHISGTIGSAMGDHAGTFIKLNRLVHVEPTKSSERSQCDCTIAINKSLLQLYIEQRYPDDKMLKALVEAI